MSKHIKSLSELRDSKIQYEKDMPAFGYIIALLFFAIIVATVIWGTYTIKPYIVKGYGTVESPNKNYIMTPVTGLISDMGIKEGDYVSQGDVIFLVKSTDINVQNKQIENQKKIYENQVSQYGKDASGNKMIGHKRNSKDHSPNFVRGSDFLLLF